MATLETFRAFTGDVTDIWEIGFQTSEDPDPLVLADLDVNFTCKVAVQGSAIDRAVTVKTGDNKRFRVWLTAAETEALGRGDHRVAIQLRNDTLAPPLDKQTQFILRLADGIAS